MRCASRAVLAFAFAASASVQDAPAQAQAQGVRTVAVGPGGTIGLPLLDDAGRTQFGRRLDDGGTGIFRDTAGTVALLFRDEFHPPGTPDDVRVYGFSAFQMSGTGRMTFGAWLRGNSVTQKNDRGIWQEGAGGLALLARTDSPAPGTASGVVFDQLRDLQINRSGQLAFDAVLRSGPTLLGSGIWSGDVDHLRLVAANNMQAPGLPSGAVSGDVNMPVLNDAGRTAFVAAIAGPGATEGSQSIWSEGGGSLALLARSGDRAPGTPSGVTYGSHYAGSDTHFPTPPAINNAGRTAFAANLTGTGVNDTNASGVWVGTPGDVTLVARAGSQAPGVPAGVNFADYRNASPVLNDAGKVAFTWLLSGTGVDSTNNAGIWAGEPGGLSLVARSGAHAPGTPNGLTFLALPNASTLNNAGQVAFRAWLSGTGGDYTNVGIWATDLAGELHLIARKGDVLQVAPGDFRTIDTLEMVYGASPSDGSAPGRPSWTPGGTRPTPRTPPRSTAGWRPGRTPTSRSPGR